MGGRKGCIAEKNNLEAAVLFMGKHYVGKLHEREMCETNRTDNGLTVRIYKNL